MAYNPMPPAEIRAAIISEAQKQFLENGIANTEMKAIAQACGIGRTTLYRYFPCKDQLAFIVSGLVMMDFLHFGQQQVPPAPLRGLERLRIYSYSLLDYGRQKPITLEYITEFDRLYKNYGNMYAESKQYSEQMQEMLAYPIGLFNEGLADGSIQTEIPASLFVSALTNAVFGIAQRVFNREAVFHEEQGYYGYQIGTTTVDLMLKAIAPQQK